MKPKETGGNVPKPKVKVKPKVVKVAPEATRPVTPKQRKAIDQGVNKAATQQLVKTVLKTTKKVSKDAALQTQAAEAERRINSGALPGVPKSRVVIRKGKLYKRDPILFGISHRESPVQLSGSGFTTKPTKSRLDSAVDTAGKKVAAPALKYLDISAKPAELTGKAVQAGLKAAGAGKTVQTVGRVAGEFLAPTNFGTFGYGKGAKMLEEAAQKAEKAGKIKRAASLRKAAQKNRRGISAGVRVHIPLTQKTFEKSTSGKTTARVMGKLPEIRKNKTVSRVGQELIHDFRPGHLNEEQHTAIRHATRERRAAVANADRAAVKVSRARDKAIGKNGAALENAMERAPHSVQQQQALVRAERIRRGTMKARVKLEQKGAKPETIRRARLKATKAQDAYEAQLANLTRHNPRELSPQLQKVAEHTRKGFQATEQTMAAKGISPGKFAPEGPTDAQRFFPHVHQTKLETKRAEDVAFRPKPRQGVAKAQRRKIRQPLNVSTALAPETFVHGKPVQSLAHYERTKAEDIANHDFWQAVSKTGRPYNASTSVATGAGERVYRVENRKGPVALEEWTGQHSDDLANAALNDSKNTYVVLNKNTVEKLKRDLRMPGTGEGDTVVGRGLDRIIGGWKTTVTVYNPSYHTRNLIGDSINARLADTHSQAFRQSSKVLGALHKREHFRGSPESLMGAPAPKALDTTIKIRNYGETKLGDIINHAERMGVIRTGQHGAEVRELLGGSAAKAGRLRALSEYREDLPRMATFLAALSRGKTLEEAADWSLKHHFDYADLTQVERRLRRVFPFWTFWARNTRLQYEKLLTRNGKYARLGVFLDEMANLAGYQDYGDYASKNLTNTNQRGIPVPIRWNGRVHPVFIGMTQTDLNNVETNPDQMFDNVAQRVTFLKLVAELHYNQSAFFRTQVEDPRKPLVPAPVWVKPLMGTPVGKFLHVNYYVDRRSGERILGWRAKADYTFRSLSPQTNTAVQFATGKTGSRNMDATEQGIATFTGVRITNPDPTTVKINNLYEQRIKIDAQLGELQQRLGKDLTGRYKRTKQTEALKASLKKYDQAIGQLRIKRGDPKEEIPSSQKPHVGRTGSLISQSSGPSVNDILGHGAPSVKDILGQ